MVVMNVITYSIEYQAVVLLGKKSFFLIVYLCISRYYVAEWECFEDWWNMLVCKQIEWRVNILLQIIWDFY